MKKIIFYDGLCNFCDGFINFIIKNERSGANLFFATLESKIAREKLMIEDKDKKNQYIVFFVNNSEKYIKSKAVFEIFNHIKFPYNILSFFSIFPVVITDYFYMFFAKFRYRIFGYKTECKIPSRKIREKFLE